MSHIVVIEGPNRGALLSLVNGENQLGRASALQITLPDKSISRKHASIRLSGGEATLSDLGSTNATYVNGIRVNTARTLVHGDEVRLGETTLLYVTDDAPRATGAGSAESTARPDTSKIEPAAVSAEMARNGAHLPRSATSEARPRYLVGDSAALARISDLVERCAPLDSNVLILGESGTGKELVAEALHRLGPRRGEPFVVVNCANLEPALLESELFGHERGSFTGAVARKLGKLELVRNGTLFLDEVGELPLDAQAKLLRALDRREFQRVGGNDTLRTTARFVAATHRDLAGRVRDGKFREDLLFRMRVVEIVIPPLRERPEDIRPISRHLLLELRERLPTPVRTVSTDALELMRRYRFPGNVRELRNVLERCLIFCDHAEIGTVDLPIEVREGMAALPSHRTEPATEPELDPAPPPAVAQRPMAHGLPALAEGEVGDETQPLSIVRGPTDLATLAEVEKSQIQRAMDATGGNKSRAARILGIDRNTLTAKMKRHGLEPE